MFLRYLSVILLTIGYDTIAGIHTIALANHWWGAAILTGMALPPISCASWWFFLDAKTWQGKAVIAACNSVGVGVGVVLTLLLT